jgi:hypothetical protein
MIKRVLFSLFLMATVFSCVSWANIPQYRFRFAVNAPFLLEKGAEVALPAGEYYVKDIGTASGHLLSLQRAKDLRHLAYLNTVRIDRAVINWTDKPRAVFDYENTELPVFKEFYIPGTDGYEILSAKYDKHSKVFVDIASLSRAKFTITERTITETETAPVETAPVETAPEPAPTPEPEVEAPPVEQPKAEPQENIEPVAPIKERRRVRKD